MLCRQCKPGKLSRDIKYVDLDIFETLPSAWSIWECLMLCQPTPFSSHRALACGVLSESCHDCRVDRRMWATVTPTLLERGTLGVGVSGWVSLHS